MTPLISKFLAHLLLVFWPQYVSVPFTAGASAGTFSVRATGNCSIAGSATTCSISQTATAGDLDIFACYTVNPGSVITGVSSGVGALSFPVASPFGSYGTGVGIYQTFAYVLPATSGAQASPVVITISPSSGGTGGSCYLAELTPSANGSLVGLATDTAYQPAAACTTCTNAAITLNGTAEALYQGFFGTDNYQGPTSVAAPYATNAFIPSFMGFTVAANPGSGNGAVWTTTSVTPQEQAIGFSFSPAAFVPQHFLGFEAGTNTGTPTAATLVSSAQGTGCGQWTVGSVGTIRYSSASSMALLSNMGLLGDGSSPLAGAGSIGILATSTGTTLGLIQCTSVHSNVNNVVFVAKVNDNAGATDNSACDCFTVHGTSGDYAAFNNYGTGASRDWGIETSTNSGTHFNLSGGTSASACGTAAGQGCTVVTYYNGGGSGVTASSVTASVTGSTVSFVGTFTAANWPAGFAFTPSGCTGGTNYNGKLFFVASSGSSLVTASSTSYTNGGTAATTSGTTTTCTLTGQHAQFYYDHTGALFGTSFAPGSTSANPYSYYLLGDTTHPMTSGDKFLWDSIQLSFNGTVPIF